MKIKEVYLKDKNRRYKEIEKVKKENIQLVMNPIEKIKENWIALLGVLVIIIGFLLLNFVSRIFLVSLALILLLVIVFIYGNKATLTCDKNELKVKQAFQKVSIPYANLKNIYIGRRADLIVFVPTYSYNIILRYEDNFGFTREFQYSVLCAQPDKVDEFLNNFEMKNEIVPKYVKYEKRKFWTNALATICSIGLVVAICIYLICNNMIKF